ncbi:MAG: TetR/AcrR family transcriptional regulator [Solirubrobacterales bacterium]
MAKGSLTDRGRLPVETASGEPRARREQEILDAAVDTFHAKGYAATSVDDIASAAGILKGSLYYYIDSKEDLLWLIVQEVHHDVAKLMKTALARTELAPLERLAEYVRGQVDYNARNIKRIRVYYHDYDQLSTENVERVRESRRQNEGLVLDLIREAKVVGELPANIDVRLATNTAYATIIWMYTWFKPKGGVSGEAYGEFCAEFVVSGLRGARSS